MTRERDEKRALVAKMPEHVQDCTDQIERWIEAFEMVQPIVCLSDHSRCISEAVLELVQLGEKWVGLKAQGLFLCAEPDGRVTLSRKECRAWESFACRATGAQEMRPISSYYEHNAIADALAKGRHPDVIDGLWDQNRKASA